MTKNAAWEKWLGLIWMPVDDFERIHLVAAPLLCHPTTEVALDNVGAAQQFKPVPEKWSVKPNINACL